MLLLNSLYFGMCILFIVPILDICNGEDGSMYNWLVNVYPVEHNLTIPFHSPEAYARDATNEQACRCRHACKEKQFTMSQSSAMYPSLYSITNVEKMYNVAAETFR